MNYSTIKKYDVANWLGVRTSLFVTFCPHRCPHCFNKDLWEEGSGKPFDEQAKKELFEYLSDIHVCGLSVLGGEPLAQGQDMLNLLIEVKEKFPTKNIALWTGYYIDGREELTNIQHQILNCCDVIVDGRFVNDLKDAKLKFRGSSNQTIYERDKITKELKPSKLNG